MSFDLVFLHGGEDLSELYRLRLACLRDGPGGAELVGDDLPSTTHVLAIAGGVLVGAGSLIADPAPFDPEISWRLRALCVEEAARGLGLGRLLVKTRLELCWVKQARSWAQVREGTSERLHQELGGVAVSTGRVVEDAWSSGFVIDVVHGDKPVPGEELA